MTDPIDPLPPIPVVARGNTSYIPSSSPSENPTAVSSILPSTPPQSKKKILVIAALLVFLFIIFSLGAVTVLAAYEKITLPTPLQYGAIALVQSLPFTPKTSKYILGKSLLKLKDLKTFSFDFSISTKIEAFKDYLGSDTSDMILKGPVNLTDLKNPQFALNLKVNTDFEGDLVFNTSKTYFRFVKVPAKPLSAFSLTQNDISPLLNQWIMATSSGNIVESQAQSKLNEYTNQKTPEEIISEQAVLKIMNEEVFSKIKMDSKTLDNHPSYHLSLTLNSSDIKQLLTKLNSRVNLNKRLTTDQISLYSSLFQNILLENWIDSSSSDLLQTSLVTTIKVPSDLNAPTQVLGISTLPLASSSATPQENFLKQDTVTLAIVLKLSDQNKPVSISFPDKYVTVEEFFQNVNNTLTKVQTAVNPQNGNPLLILSSLKTALDDYYTSYSKYPRNFDELAQGLPKYTLNNSMRLQINDARIVFKTSKDQSEVLLYSFTPITDPNTSLSHYSAIHFKNGQSATLSLTQEGLMNQIKGF